MPPNITSHYQPCDQGIIKNFKVQYRRFWISYFIEKTLSGSNPLQSINLLHTLQWACLGWGQVSKDTIENCWKASTIVDSDTPVATEGLEELQALLQQGQQLQVIRQAMDIHRFIDPPCERIYNISPDEALEHVVELFTEAEDDSEPTPEPPISHKEAVNYLEKLLYYESSQSDSKESYWHALEGLKRKASTRWITEHQNNRQQMSITSFFCT